MDWQPSRVDPSSENRRVPYEALLQLAPDHYWAAGGARLGTYRSLEPDHDADRVTLDAFSRASAFTPIRR